MPRLKTKHFEVSAKDVKDIEKLGKFGIIGSIVLLVVGGAVSVITAIVIRNNESKNKILEQNNAEKKSS